MGVQRLTAVLPSSAYSLETCSTRTCAVENCLSGGPCGHQGYGIVVQSALRSAVPWAEHAALVYTCTCSQGETTSIVKQQPHSDTAYATDIHLMNSAVCMYL